MGNRPKDTNLHDLRAFSKFMVLTITLIMLKWCFQIKSYKFNSIENFFLNRGASDANCATDYECHIRRAHFNLHSWFAYFDPNLSSI